MDKTHGSSNTIHVLSTKIRVLFVFTNHLKTETPLVFSILGLVHISPGELLREHVRRGTQVGREAAPFMARGELVPTDIVLAVVAARLQMPDVVNRGCLLDNFPLTAEQAAAMRGRVEVCLLLQLEVPAERLAERARGRRLDPQTGAVYHVSLQPPPPDVAHRLERRADDAEESVALRLATYARHAGAIRPFFEGVAHRVDAARAPAEVFASIASLLDAHGWGATTEEPYVGSKAFGGRFSERQVSTRILGRRTAPFPTFPNSSPRPAWFNPRS